LAHLFGGFDLVLQTLVIFMAVDYITGMVVAGVFKKSRKTKTGTLQSRAGLKGLCKKGVTLLIVLVAVQLDKIIGSAFVENAVVIGFITNETVSIIENAGLMGIPMPDAIRKSVDILNKKTDEKQ
jgi:toxin secretion/phage lysis holin